MIGRISLIAVAFAMSLPTLAFASHCPKDAKAIDHGLQASKVESTSAAEIRTLRDKGMELHKAGKHRESEKILAEAMRKLLMAQ